MSIVFGGYIIDSKSQRHQVSVISDPGDSVIEEALLRIKQADGVLGLRHKPTPETGPYELILHAENGNFLLMLNEYDEDGDTNVRTITNASAENRLMSILGESYPAKAITRNFQLICTIFKEFSTTGDVSKKIMN